MNIGKAPVMAKILLVSILLMLVYSWEEFKYSAKFFLRFLIYRNKRSPASYPKAIDRFVSMSISLAVIPIGLAFFLEAHTFSAKNLILLAASLLGVAMVAWFSAFVTKRLAGLSYYEQMGAGALAAYELASLVSPTMRWFADFDLLERKALSKFALYLSLPAFVGLALKFILGQSYIDARFMPALDVLIQILVMALIINVAIAFLEKNFRAHRLTKVSHFFRILLGIVLATVLIFR